MEPTSFATPAGSGPGVAGPDGAFPTAAPQMALLEFFFPGFSMFSGAVQRYLHVDLNVYIPLIFMASGALFAWRYFSDYFWSELESHFMSTVDVRTDDEAYNMLMSWVARQRFAQRSRRFVVNTNLNSRSWWVFRWDEDEDEDDTEEGTSKREARKLSYTPTFGSHYFWYKGRLLIFRRTQNREQATFMVASEREEISVSCFGRNPWILKELLMEARSQYIKRDERKTVIYRGSTKSGSTEPSWQRCMARTARPLSTVILNEKVKKDLIEDVSDYLNPATRRWYSNRGIPYRRGFLLHGPPGCGKSSLSLALAGHFKMPIYMVSLSSVTASEENLASLFAELPRRCVVLLEDIDTAGLTHTRDENKAGEVAVPAPAANEGGGDMVPGQVTPGIVVGGGPAPNNSTGRLSLSGLLNILDGVASQDSRVLLMSTNHIEKLDKALIRPGRVDMIVKFDLADKDMTAAIFRHIYAPLEGDEEQPGSNTSADANASSPSASPFASASSSDGDSKKALAAAHDPDAVAQRLAAEKARREEAVARVTKLAETFADRIPAHEFSPAELQGFLMKNKRDAEAALAGAEKWVADMRKEKKEKELKEAEEKRKAEEERKKKEEEEREKAKKEEEEKKKKEAEEEKEKKRKEEKEERRKRKEKERAKRKRRAKKDDLSDSDSSLSESSDDEKETPTGSTAEEPPKVKKEASTVSTAETVVVVVKKAEGSDEADVVDSSKLTADEGKKGTGTDSGYGTP